LEFLRETFPGEKQPRFHGALREAQQAGDLGDVMSFDGGKNDDETELRRQLVYRTPQQRAAFLRDGDFLDRRLDVGPDGSVACQSPAVAALPVDGKPPCSPHEPGTKPIFVAKLRESRVRPRKCILRDILGILTVSHHTVGNPKRQAGGVTQAHLELSICRILGHEKRRVRYGAFIHSGSVLQDAAGRRPVQ